MSDSNNPVATITNNSSVDVDVYDVFNTTGEQNATLTYTKLGTVKKEQTQQLQTGHFASQLQAMYTGAIPALNGNYYYQFPVAVMPIVPLGFKNRTSYTITNDDKSGMEQSFLFQKYVVANADSQIAKDFFTALADPDQDQEKAVNKFFSATKNFKTCSLSAWTAVVTWAGQFTSAWQGPYYLYSVPPKESTSPPKLISTVSITSTASSDSAVLAVSDSTQSTRLSMNGTGLQESNVGAGGISVSLKPAWLNVVQTDSQGDANNTRYLIGTALTGVVNGITVFGTGEKRTIPSSSDGGGQSDADKQRKDQQEQQSFDRLFSKVATLIGLGVSMLTAYFFYRQLKQGHNQKSNEAAEKAGKKPGATDESVDHAVKEEAFDYETHRNSAPKDIQGAQAKVGSEMKPALDAVAKQEKINTLDNVVDEQVDKLTEVLETKPPTEALENTAKKLSEFQSDLQDIQDGKPDAKSLDDVTSGLKDVSSTIETQSKSSDWQHYEKEALEKTKEAVDDSVDVKEAVDKAEAEREKETEADPEDPDFDPDFTEPETDPVEPIEGI